jgi:hypothetical protein
MVPLNRTITPVGSMPFAQELPIGGRSLTGTRAMLRLSRHRSATPKIESAHFIRAASARVLIAIPARLATISMHSISSALAYLSAGSEIAYRCAVWHSSGE